MKRTIRIDDDDDDVATSMDREKIAALAKSPTNGARRANIALKSQDPGAVTAGIII